MEDLLAKIYHSVISNERISNNLGEQYDEKIQKIIVQYKENMSEDEADELQEILYDMAYIIEQGGFIHTITICTIIARTLRTRG